MYPFHKKLPFQKPMLRQIECWVQNGPIKKNGVLPVTTLFFWKFCFSLRTSSKRLISFANNANAHIRTFCKNWSFIWWCFFLVSILTKLCLEIYLGNRFLKLILLTYLEHITNISMCFFLGKFISEIHEYSQKSEKFISS